MASFLEITGGERWKESGLQLILEKLDFGDVGNALLIDQIRTKVRELESELGADSGVLLFVVSALNASVVRTVLDDIIACGINEGSWVYRQSSVSSLAKLEASLGALGALLVETVGHFASEKGGANAVPELSAALRCSHELLNETSRVLLSFRTQEPIAVSEHEICIERISKSLEINRELLTAENLINVGTERIIEHFGVG